MTILLRVKLYPLTRYQNPRVVLLLTGKASTSRHIDNDCTQVESYVYLRRFSH